MAHTSIYFKGTNTEVVEELIHLSGSKNVIRHNDISLAVAGFWMTADARKSYNSIKKCLSLTAAIETVKNEHGYSNEYLVMRYKGVIISITPNRRK